MEYAKEKDILRVQQLLGHKQIKNTEIYTHLTEFKAEEWTVRRPRNSKEDELIEDAFNTYDTTKETSAQSTRKENETSQKT
jgi:hypothetical protein